MRFLTLLFVCSAFYIKAQNCPAPLDLAALGIKATSAGVIWQEIPDAQTYKVEWRQIGAPFWTSAQTLNNYYRIQGLTLCTNYEARVQSNCGSGNLSDFTDTVQFMTNCIPDCDAPIGNYATFITDSSAVLNWTQADTTAFRVRIREQGDTTWQLFDVDGNFLFLSQLDSCATYEWQVQTLCSWMTGDFGLLRAFTTYCGECAPPMGVVEFDVQATSARFISMASAGAVSYDFQWREQGQTVWSAPLGSSFNGILIDDFEPCKSYEIRSRAVCVDGESDWSNPLMFNTLCSNEPCDIIPSIQVDSVDFSFVQISWQGDPLVLGYTVQFKDTAAGDWVSLDVLPDGFVTVPNLDSCTDYYIRIRTNCPNGVSQFSDTVLVKTSCLPCDKITGAASTGIGFVEAAFIWTENTDAMHYEVQYRPLGGDWVSDTAAQNGILLSGLDVCADYELRVRALCVNVGDWSEVFAFSTQCCPVPNGLMITANDFGTASFEWDDSGVGLWAVRYRPTQSLDFNYRTVTANSVVLDSLMFCAEYYLEVAAICSNDTTDWIGLDFDAFCCTPPNSITNANVGLTGQRLSWAGTAAEHWTVALSEVMGTFDTVYVTDTAFLFLSGLDDCTEYDLVVANDCGQSDSISFMTLCCPMPSSVSAFFGEGNVVLEWDAPSTALTWELMLLDDATGSVLNTDLAFDREFTYGDLEACGNYHVEIRSLCSGATSEPFDFLFQTPCCTTPELMVENVGYTSATAVWDADTSATYALTIYANGNTFSIINIEGGELELSDLDSCTEYTIVLEDECAGFGALPAADLMFKTLCTSALPSVVSPKIQLYPNPVNRIVYLENEELVMSVKIMDMQGKVVAQYIPNALKTQINVEDITPGHYIIEVIDVSNQIYIERILVE